MRYNANYLLILMISYCLAQCFVVNVVVVWNTPAWIYYNGWKNKPEITHLISLYVNAPGRFHRNNNNWRSRRRISKDRPLLLFRRMEIRFYTNTNTEHANYLTNKIIYPAPTQCRRVGKRHLPLASYQNLTSHRHRQSLATWCRTSKRNIAKLCVCVCVVTKLLLVCYTAHTHTHNFCMCVRANCKFEEVAAATVRFFVVVVTALMSL